MGAIVKYYNLTGGLNTTQGIGTINQSPRRTESPDMQNVEYYKLGGVKSMEGNKQFSDTIFLDSDGNPCTITLGHEYIYKSNKYLLVCTYSQKAGESKLFIYNNLTNKFDEIYQFPTATPRHSIVSFNNGVIVSNGVDDLLFYQRGRNTLLSGNVSTDTASTTITGTLTKFQTELSVGDYITINGVEGQYRVTEIVSDTELAIDRYPASAVSMATIRLSEISLCNARFKNADDAEVDVRGLALQSYQGRIWVGGDNGVLYYSEIGLIHGWDVEFGAGAIPEFYNDNSDFTALALWDKYLVICKREQSYLLNGTNEDTANWTIEPYSRFTCDSQQSWIDAIRGLYVYSRSAGGIYPVLERTIYSALYLGQELSFKIKDSLEYINTALYDYIFPVYHPKKNYLIFYTPMLTGVGSNTAFVYDVQTKTWLKRVVPQDVSIAFRFNDEIYIGTRDGKVLKEFSGLTFDGEPIEFYWRSPWFDFGEGTNQLTTKEFRIKISEESTNRFHIRNRRNGIEDYKDRALSNNLDAFLGLVWDIGENEADFNTAYTLTRKVSQVTDGENIYYVPEDLTEYGEGYKIPNGTMLYLNSSCRDYYNIVGVPFGLQLSDSSDYDETKASTTTGYKYNLSYNQYWRLDNGTDYLWYSGTTDVPRVGDSIRVSRKEVKELTGMYMTLSAGNIAVLKTTKVYYKTSDKLTVNGSAGYSLDWYRDVNGNEKSTLNSNQGTWHYIIRGTSADIKSAYQVWGISSTGQMMSWNVSSTSWKDIYETVQEATGSNINEASEAVIQAVTETADGVYTIRTNLGTFTGMTNKTAAGNITNTIVYSKTNGYETGSKLYSDTGCTVIVGEWLNNDTSNNASYFPNGSTVTLATPTEYQRPITLYYKKQTIEFTFNGEVEDVTNPWVYPFTPNPSDETLTDTVWADGVGEVGDVDYEPSTKGDSWVRTQHIVKRFPLPNQYFQTLQVEFYGNAVDEGMSVYGFEIDGVELEEVPVR